MVRAAEVGTPDWTYPLADEMLDFGERQTSLAVTVRQLGERVPLLKHVAARPGQIVCRIDAVVSVDGRPVVVAQQRDGRGRTLPVWQGCRTLRAGELLMLNPDHADSMDGRYFGPLPASTVLGRATPILTRNTPDAPLTWR